MTIDDVATPVPQTPAEAAEPVMPWSLRRRLLAVLGTAAVLGLVVGIVAIVSLVRVDAAIEREVNRLDPANAAVLDMYGGMLDQETGVRGYVLAHDTSFLQPYQDGLTEQSQAQTTAERLLAHEPVLSAQLKAAQAADADWQDAYAKPAIARVQAGQDVSADLTNTGKTKFDAVRAAYTTLRTELAVARTNAKNQLESAVTTRWIAIGVAACVAIAFTVALFLGLRRWVTGPLAELAGQTREVASGDLERGIDVAGPAEVLALGADVDAMREALRDQLAQAQSAADRFAEQAQSLARSNAELEQFAYVASHDLQEPLRKVASFCQLLEQRYGDQLDERAHTYIEFAVDGAKRMQSLINDLLAFSRAGRAGPNLTKVDLRELVGQVRADLATAIEESGAVITTAEHLPVVEGDATLLGQLLTNLVGNAIKFRTGEAPRVELTSTTRGRVHTICCTDNGIGIEAQYADKVFLIFQRLHPKDVYPGTGIGLALCKKIVEYHGGRIWLDTAHAPGARICFTLPVERKHT